MSEQIEASSLLACFVQVRLLASKDKVLGHSADHTQSPNLLETHMMKTPTGVGILSAPQQTVISTAHTTPLAMQTQLVFLGARDAPLNISFQQADWECINKECKQKLIHQNNQRENAALKPYTCGVGDRVMIMQDPNRKHGSLMDSSVRSR